MQHAAGLRHEDSQHAKLDKLDAMLALTRTPNENAALFAEMLSLANDGRYPALSLVPQQRREKTLKALIAQVELLERDCPVLMIFEDAHWTDPTSLEALYSGRCADEIVLTDAQGVFRRLELAEHLTPQRSNGFASMVERICTDSRRAMSGEARTA